MTKLASSLNNAASSKAPSGWEPYTETHGDQIGEAIVRLPSPNSTARDLLVTAGFDPDCWRIDGLIDTRKWMRYDQEWLYYYKFKVKAGESPEAIEVHVDELTKLIRKRGRWARRTVTGGDDAFAFFMSDLQIGKREGEIGTPQIVERYLEALDMAVGRVKELRRIGRKMPTIALIGLGDVVEGCFAAETPVITSRGIRPIVDLAHEGSATIRTAYGRWVDAEFRSFGRQRLVRLELVRQNERRTVFTTAEHRWFKLSNPSSNSAKIELIGSPCRPMPS